MQRMSAFDTDLDNTNENAKDFIGQKEVLTYDEAFKRVSVAKRYLPVFC